MAAVKALQQWCKIQCDGYRDVSITNMTTSFRDGLAFCALIHKHRPDLIDFDSLSKENIYENNQLAFQVAENELGIPALLDAEDMVAMRVPDRLSILTYVSQYYNYFHGRSPIGGMAAIKRPAEESNEEPSGKKNQPVAAKVFVSPKPATEAQKPKSSIDNKREVLAERANKQGTLSSSCNVCSQHVHLVQRHLVDGKLYHRNCFKCKECTTILLSGTYKAGKEPGTFICKTHSNVEKHLSTPTTNISIPPTKTQPTTVSRSTTSNLTDRNSPGGGTGKAGSTPIASKLGWLANKSDRTSNLWSPATPAPTPTPVPAPRTTPASKTTLAPETTTTKSIFNLKTPTESPTNINHSVQKNQEARKRFFESSSNTSTSTITSTSKNSPSATSTTSGSTAGVKTSTLGSLAGVKTSTSVSPASGKISAFLSPVSVKTSAFLSPASVKTSAFASPASVKTSTSVSPASVKTSTSVSPASVKTSTSLTPASVKTSTSLTPASVKTSTFVSPASVKTSTFVSPASVKTSTSVNPVSVKTSTSVTPASVKTSTSTSVTPASVKTSTSVTPVSVKASTSLTPASVKTSTSLTPASVKTSTSLTPASVKTSMSGSPAPGPSVGTGKGRLLLRVGDWAKVQDEDIEKDNEKEKAKTVIGKMMTGNKNQSGLSQSPAGLKANGSNVSSVESGVKGPSGRVHLKPLDDGLDPTAPAAGTPSWIKDKNSPRPASSLSSNSKENDKTPSDWRSMLKPVSKTVASTEGISSPNKKTEAASSPGVGISQTSGSAPSTTNASPGISRPMAPSASPPKNGPSDSKSASSVSPVSSSGTETHKLHKPDHIPKEEILKELKEIEMNLNQLEKRGVELEKELRQSDEDGEEDTLMNDLMVDWFSLIRNKQVYMRRESELVYIAKTQDLEEEQPSVEAELRRLMEKPDHLKTSRDRKREEELMAKLVEIVNDRNAIIEGLDEDRLREGEEDEQLNKMMQDLDVKKEKVKRKSSMSRWFSRKSKRPSEED
ncbi:protein-methionine sulfoxide oxidase mical2b [Triplophysa dalaica]|uniref:protein-methionine sulfoxide oxidase mical2b n=1 Tax=Triplophysa dalaica TaxID=1582913 RepID=UPI0024DFCCD0|nr:protein-methionine sulfoxide oxidase mical2b [Triplophysa dalaica]